MNFFPIGEAIKIAVSLNCSQLKCPSANDLQLQKLSERSCLTIFMLRACC